MKEKPRAMRKMLLGSPEYRRDLSSRIWLAKFTERVEGCATFCCPLLRRQEEARRKNALFTL